MKGDMLTRALGGIGDDLIAEADGDRVRLHFARRLAKRRKVTLIAACAAAICVIFALSLFAAGRLTGGNAPNGNGAGNENDKTDGSAESGSEIRLWNGIHVTKALYNELTRDFASNDGKTDSGTVSGTKPEAGEFPDSPDGSEVAEPPIIGMRIIVPNASAKEKVISALEAAGISCIDRGDIHIRIDANRLASFNGDWVDQCIFDLDKQ